MASGLSLDDIKAMPGPIDNSIAFWNSVEKKVLNVRYPDGRFGENKLNSTAASINLGDTRKIVMVLGTRKINEATLNLYKKKFV